MKPLEYKAKDYGENWCDYNPDKIWEDMYPTDVSALDFIAGATSMYVKADKIKALIDENKSLLSMLKKHDNAQSRLFVTRRITELEEQLKQLEDENT
jgi:DNA-binding transcriptional MerR regulator